MTDIVERLRRSSDPFWHHTRPDLVTEAADEIERLRAEKLELANHIDGCVRVAADALKRAESAEALLAIANTSGVRDGKS